MLLSLTLGKSQISVAVAEKHAKHQEPPISSYLLTYDTNSSNILIRSEFQDKEMDARRGSRLDRRCCLDSLLSCCRGSDCGLKCKTGKGCYLAVLKAHLLPQDVKAEIFFNEVRIIPSIDLQYLSGSNETCDIECSCL